MSEIFSISGQNIRASARAEVVSALSQIAQMKNVPLNPGLREVLAENAIRRLDFASLYQIVGQEEQGLTAMVREVDAELNATVLARMWNLIALFEGKKDFIDDPALPKQGVARWPDPMQLVADHYAKVPRGPIVETRDDGGVLTTWWLGREPHRDPGEGPALHWVHDEKQGCEYWFDGKLHRPHEDGPARRWTPFMDMDASGEEYFEHGKFHRPAGLGPAVRVWSQGGEPVVEIYYENGELHRDPSAGPAWWRIRDARTDPKVVRPCTEIKYFVGGKLRRDEENGPAVIVRDNATGIIVNEQYWQHGKRHRDGGPAHIRRDETGKVLLEGWHRDGKLHRDPIEGPALFEVRERETEWYGRRMCTGIMYGVGGELHRDEKQGPAVTIADNASGMVLEEQYWRHGKLHREKGRCRIHRDAEGRPVWETWEQNDQPHRDPAEGPANIWHDRERGEVMENYWVNGEAPPASVSPAYVVRDLAGKVIFERFQDGERGHDKYPAPIGAEGGAHG